MKKVVINSCFGGFSLSAKAVKRLAELQGKECYFFSSLSGSLTEGKYAPITIDELERSLFWLAFDIPNPNKVLADNKSWGDMSLKERKASNARYNKHSIDSRPENREDPFLIQVIEELGEEANGRCASLEIIEIPDDVEYVIDEYDGNESIHEKHRSWG